MFVSRLDKIAPVHPVHPIHKNPPKYQPEFKKALNKSKENMEEALKLVEKTEEIIKEVQQGCQLPNPRIKRLETEIKDIKEIVKAYKTQIREVEANQKTIDTPKN